MYQPGFAVYIALGAYILSNHYHYISALQVLEGMVGLPEFPKQPEINSKGIFGNTPLKVAAVWGDAEAIELLLAAGAHIDEKNEHGHTALHHAAAQGNIKAVEVLVANGANATIQNDDGKTAFECATRKDIIEYLQVQHLTHHSSGTPNGAP